MDYVIGTGRPWNGIIGKGTIVFDLENSISTAWSKRPSLPGPNMKVTRNESSVRIEFEKYEPGPEDEIRLSFYPPWAPACSGFVDKEFVSLLSGKPRKHLREMRNEVFARRGYVFEDKELAALFSGKPWYKPDAGFKQKMVSKKERETIAEIKRIEDRK